MNDRSPDWEDKYETAKDSLAASLRGFVADNTLKQWQAREIFTVSFGAVAAEEEFGDDDDDDLKRLGL